jgi:hypothetical protein
MSIGNGQVTGRARRLASSSKSLPHPASAVTVIERRAALAIARSLINLLVRPVIAGAAVGSLDSARRKGARIRGAKPLLRRP